MVPVYVTYRLPGNYALDLAKSATDSTSVAGLGSYVPDLGAGVPEDRIPVTPEMIEAGVAAYGLFEFADPGEWTVTAIYRAMEHARRSRQG